MDIRCQIIILWQIKMEVVFMTKEENIFVNLDSEALKTRGINAIEALVEQLKAKDKYIKELEDALSDKEAGEISNAAANSCWVIPSSFMISIILSFMSLFFLFTKIKKKVKSNKKNEFIFLNINSIIQYYIDLYL